MIQDKLQGLTLPELVACLLVLATCGYLGSITWQHVVPSQQVVSATNAVHGLMHFARAEASAQGAIAMCAREECDYFGVSQRLLLQRPGQPPVTQLQLPGQSTVSWHSFQGKPELLFHRDGRLHYQNGHLLICHPRGQSRRLVLNRTGRVRVEHHPEDKIRCEGRRPES